VRFVLRDHDAKFPRSFDDVVRSQGAQVLVTPVPSPKANGYAERWIRTVRAECLDWLLILGRNHLDQVLRVYVQHYNGHRPPAPSGCKRQIRRPGRPSPGRIMEARCIDATCSAVCFTSTASCMNAFAHPSGFSWRQSGRLGARSQQMQQRLRVGIDEDKVGEQLEIEGWTSSPPATRRCSTSSRRRGRVEPMREPAVLAELRRAIKITVATGITGNCDKAG
jgi:hypothetical protein